MFARLCGSFCLQMGGAAPPPTPPLFGGHRRFHVPYVFFVMLIARGLNKPHHDRCKPRSHGGSGKGALGVRPLLGRPMAMYTLVTLAARAGIDRVRTGSQHSGTRRQRTEKSGFSWSFIIFIM